MECKRIYAPSKWDTVEDAERKKNGPPCVACKPDLLPENAQAFFIYHLSEDQVIMAPDGSILAIYDSSVQSNMGIHGVKDTAECHIKVKNITRTILKAVKEAKDAD